MKLKDLFAFISLCVMVKGTWWAAAVRPVVLSLGAVLGAIDLDVLDVQPVNIEWKKLIPFINKQEDAATAA